MRAHTHTHIYVCPHTDSTSVYIYTSTYVPVHYASLTEPPVHIYTYVSVLIILGERRHWDRDIDICIKKSPVPAPPQVRTPRGAYRCDARPAYRDVHAPTAVPRPQPGTRTARGKGLRGPGRARPPAQLLRGPAGPRVRVRPPAEPGRDRGRSGAERSGHGGGGGGVRVGPAAGGRPPGSPSGFRGGGGGGGGVGPRPGQPDRRAHRLQRRLRAAHGKGRAPPPRPRHPSASPFRVPPCSLRGSPGAVSPPPAPGCPPRDPATAPGTTGARSRTRSIGGSTPQTGS